MISHLDHLVLTVLDIQKSVDFYSDLLGMEVITFGENRTALKFGSQKINLHEKGAEVSPHANSPIPGSSDLCFISTKPIDELIKRLERRSIPIIEGPVERTGAISKLNSIYFRDPDQNLIEVSNLLREEKG